MNKTYFLLCWSAALFAAGYFIRGPLSAPAGPRTEHVSAAAPPASGDSPSLRPPQPGAEEVRAFVPGRPFAHGGARDWILTLLPSLGGDRRGNAIVWIQHLQTVTTMDGDAVREMLHALEELTAEADAKNPERRRNPNGDGKLDTLTELAMIRMAQTHPGEALEWLRKNFSLNDGTTRLMVMGTLANGDPVHAEQMALSLEKNQQKDALESVMYALMNRDPHAALALADRHPEIMGEMHRKRVFEGWVRRDAPAAMNAVVQMAAQPGGSEIVRKTIEEWAKSDHAAAAAWAAAYEGPGKVTARAMILEKQAREHPHAALAAYAALQQAGGPPGQLDRITTTLADALAGKDVAAARTWAESLTDPGLRNRALHQVAEQWVKRDAPAASEWIESLSPGELRDGAARELAAAIAPQDPAGAFVWARSIGSEPQRRSALQNVLQKWRESDPDAARAALESLPEAQRP